MDRIQCPDCGQQYDARYQTCPFCGYRFASGKQAGSRKGGKRLAGKNQSASRPAPQTYQSERGPAPQSPPPKKKKRFWSRFFFLCSIVLIIAAACIVVSIVKTLFGEKGPSDPAASAVVTVSPSANPDALSGITISPSELHLETVGDTTRLSVFPTAEGSSLDASAITWTSGDESIVTVSESGLVTAVAKGTATITAAYADLTAQCQVTVGPLPSNALSSAQPSASQNPEDSSGLKLNKEDFTLFSAGETYQLKVSGAQGDVTWSVNNKSVATVSSTGVVTAVGQGRTTVKASVDGETLECIVRVK